MLYGVDLSFYNFLSILSFGFISGSVRAGLLPTEVWSLCQSALRAPIKMSERWQGLRVLSGPEQWAPGSVHVSDWTRGQKQNREQSHDVCVGVDAWFDSHVKQVLSCYCRA